MSNMVPIKNNVRQLRQQCQLTQADLGDKVSLTRQTIAAIEQRRYSPSLEVAFRIAAVFDSPLTEVFEYDP